MIYSPIQDTILFLTVCSLYLKTLGIYIYMFHFPNFSLSLSLSFSLSLSLSLSPHLYHTSLPAGFPKYILCPLKAVAGKFLQVG